MSKKLLSGFALLVCAALVGVIVNDNPTTYADDSEKVSPNNTNETPPTTTPDEAKPAENAPTARPEALPPAFPTNELPLYPENDCIGVACRDLDINAGLDHDAALISVIVDGHKKTYQVWGDRAEDLVSFKLRTDGWTHASAQFFGDQEYSDNIFSSAVVLVPNKESLERWTKYYTKAIAWGRTCAVYYAVKRRGPSDRAYPANVLPPK